MLICHSSLVEHLVRSFAWFLKIYLFIWQCLLLVAARGIFSCSMWDLVPDQGWNLDPLHWECGVLAIGPPEKSPFFLIIVGGSRVHSIIFFLMSVGPKCTSLPTSIMYLFHTNLLTYEISSCFCFLLCLWIEGNIPMLSTYCPWKMVPNSRTVSTDCK